MTSIEKRFVNGAARRRTAARDITGLLERIPIAPGGRLLDVGCGAGSAASAIAERWDLDVVGVDVDPAQITAAQESASRPNLRFQVMDATTPEFEDGTFDIVTSSMAMHHIPRWEHALSEMIRVLRPGGYLVYIDFVFPRWLACAGWALRPLMALPSVTTVESLARTNGMEEFHRNRKGMQLHAIYRRSM